MDADTKRIRYSREVETLLKQFQKWGEGGCQAQSVGWDRGYTFTFEWPNWRKAAVNHLMNAGKNFTEAFDFVAQMSEKDWERAQPMSALAQTHFEFFDRVTRR